ncbi:tetratricopeptide repeat protein [Streptomyces litchfieldiae]|uniref:Tetratricopeptide repeat protein n=1 Tax=Streptomyces litchfieldiae TaxID=3075543 RepID=A0ABU2MPG7_9ACTN|nr:hypothetical protein [Streptomyces sp. DSM 44938]MDT0343518.1 hypothetical protein [Streptomyces sp. DSM 44938]
MTRTLSALFRARHRTSTQREEALAESVRLCAAYLAELGEKPDAGRMRLASAIGALVTARADGATDPFDALLRTGNRALEAGGEPELRLALALADAAVAVRERSQGAWRLRGLVADALGRPDEALTAYERHLALRQDTVDGGEIAVRADTLKEIRACVDEAAGLFPRHTALRDARAQGPDRIRAAFTALIRAGLDDPGPGDPAVRRLADLYATYRRLTAEGRMADPLLGGDAPVGVGPFRNLIAGRTVCLVADADQVAAAGLGEEIDGYDLVFRCDSYRSDPRGTGRRTDVHAVTLPGKAPWEGPRWIQPTAVRLVFGGSADAWRRALRRRLVPGTQRHIGDASLRRPVADPALMGESGWDKGVTTAFAVLRLLDFLDVSPRIDLIGFGLPGRLRPAEHAWVMAHARNADSTEASTQMRIALR